MKKIVVVLIAVVFLCSACYTTKVIAPPEKKITIGSPAQNCVEITSRRIWYILWGIVPLNDETTVNDLLTVPPGSAVIVEDKITFVDGLIGIFTGMLTIYPKTLKVYSCK